MPTPPNASTANAASEVNEDSLEATAKQRFIDMFVVAQSNAIALGQFQVYLSTFEHCDIPDIVAYFVSLGYIITFPDFMPVNGSQPGELFGPAWLAYWQNQLLPSNTQPKNPTRMGIAWATPITDPSDPDFSDLPPAPNF